MRIVWSIPLLSCLLFHGISEGANQTPDFSPVITDGGLPYRIELREYDFGPEELPTVHSFAAGHYDGKWLVISGRTNGLHGFDTNPFANFPPEFQNREVWVIDPVNKQSWNRDLTGLSSGLNEDQINSLTTANNQFYQRGDTLFLNGGYGYSSDDPNGNALNSTFNTLSALDLPGLIDWVQNDSGQAIDHIRQLEDDRLRITGGGMYEMDGRSFLVFGQDYGVNYQPNINGEYSHQIRSFEIVDDGTNLSIQNYAAVGDPNSDPSYRRRDLNVFPVLSPDGSGGTQEGITVLSGVFTESFGAWTHPIEIDDAGSVSENTGFKQSMNIYHSSKFGMFSEATGEMHEVLLGGLTLQYYDEESATVLEDNRVPFSNQVAAIVVDPNGAYEQHYLGEFPEITDDEDNVLRFGTNAEFFLAGGIEEYENGVLKMDQLTDGTVLGYVYGGIVANAPHVRRNPFAQSGASDRIFEVVFVAIPEPASASLAAGMLLTCLAGRRGRLQSTTLS